MRLCAEFGFSSLSGLIASLRREIGSKKKPRTPEGIAQAAVADLGSAHPDLVAKTSRMELTRYGHAMAIPVPQVNGKSGCSPYRTCASSY